MSLDTIATGSALPPLDDARRQIEICNACRYCEGYCSVFPAMMRGKVFSDADMLHLANLCHNCRGCYYSCQYTPPHEFALNLPAALAEVRQASWEQYAVPQVFARAFHEKGVPIAFALVGAVALFFAALAALKPESGAGFYAYLAHSTMVAVFVPAFLLPLLAIAAGLRRYWRDSGGGAVRLQHVLGAIGSAARLRNLDGGQGQGCNFERADRFSDRRRLFHQATMYGFLLCFASTSVATVMHYLLGMEAPYPFFSLPKLLGLAGGLLLVVGCAGLAWLKTKADPSLGDRRVWGGEMAFVLLLGFVGASGLALYAATGTGLVGALLAIHLGAVMTFFLLMPYSKMVHGFFRLAALVSEEGRQPESRAQVGARKKSLRS
ncbi:tricarballylate utilization 4Fe-4S protein TcuB [Limibaculum sp. M0105]|uniref:Tricarballylate utilization 4Fe-4S protein TcuB n=1 Tax=Thermohalobaculum xanthum TaxID=2753746 RepID=A0A8J7M6P6_9RHOB|nr:tricarballylate utilization 4Fe-4S protein TcuB [Thermohalobaculum xanthum]MBK0399581.1 tricarballylate utilization 4Fe-4S protein TcuB [Thermohalobaculum xanthum]